MKIETIHPDKPSGSHLKRLRITKKDAIHLARELLELAEGNGVNARGTESTHWVIDDGLKPGQTHFCFGVGRVQDS